LPSTGDAHLMMSLLFSIDAWTFRVVSLLGCVYLMPSPSPYAAQLLCILKYTVRLGHRHHHHGLPLSPPSCIPALVVSAAATLTDAAVLFPAESARTDAGR
jgi:hypothetical protein